MLVLDTNVLTSCASDADYFQEFLSIFKNNHLLIDPIVKVELLRGAVAINAYEELVTFLSFERFDYMKDNFSTLNKIYSSSIDIARVYNHHEKPKMPLGDLLIAGRLSLYAFDVLFLTKDNNDFGTLLFDRLGVVSIERKIKKRGAAIDHINIYQFNQQKLEECLSKFPEKYTS